MAHQYKFRVEDVTCEKCDARIRQAIADLPGAQLIEYVRTPSDEAEVLIESSDEMPMQLIEETVAQKSAGTTHNYQVRWN